MKPWHEGRPVTNRFVVLPPAGREAEVRQSKERVVAFLAERFPQLVFELGALALEDEFSVIPICGTAGDGVQAGLLAPPAREAIDEIERALNTLDLARAALS